MGTLKFRPWYLLYLLPAVVLYVVLFIYPFIQTAISSFTSWDGITKPVFVGVANYVQLFQDQVLMSGILRILIWAALAVVFKVGLGLVFAAMLRDRLKGYSFFTSVFFFPVVISSSAMSLIFSLMYDKDIGLINQTLHAVGLGFLEHAWLSDPHTAFFAAIAVPIYQDIGFFLVIFLAALQDIPNEYYESARIDGAGPIKSFFLVTLPLSLGSLRVCIVLAVTSAFKTFDYIFLLTAGGPGNSTQVPATWMYLQTFQSFKYGYGAAIAMLIFVMSMVVSGLVMGSNTFSARRARREAARELRDFEGVMA
ncbi:carbohydrate ABC transporter permease [Gryllotalpicola reticulitermitis]|uniref:Carbohydrate ABC transporter permease n=1 Tax=Gryllotalpicola reticulitermitis TaxID=1184153 RepID=A0ABV8Q4F1_9MICO